MSGVRYYTAVVDANNSEDFPGHLKLVIPQMLGTDAHPDWIPPRMSLGSGAGVWWIPAVGSVVMVEEFEGDLYWGPAPVGAVNLIPEPFKANYPNRVGITSQDAKHYLALETGGNVELVSAADLLLQGPKSSLSLTDSKTRLVTGGKVYLGSSTVDVVGTLDALIGALQTALTATALGPQPLDPVTQTTLATLKTQLATIKE